MSRVDQALVARGLAPSRTAAQRLIADGAVRIAPGHRIDRPSQQVSEFDELWVSASDETRYVSRAGAKLEHALRDTGIDPRGLTVLDLGMSTGGFADCLLQAGAARVIGIEVGHGQLHETLRLDPRIICLERTNLRDLTRAELLARVPQAPAEGCALAVADLSFISLTKVVSAIDALLASDATALLLVKPQFELGAAALDRRGIVTDARRAREAVETVASACTALGWTLSGIVDSAVPGTDGNREFFLHARTATAAARENRITA
jgi:23S rRNA (cytidine1920-2'-O)/16S rRNA (cytidine1409-2'-O)-methyltransferase